MNHFLSPTGRCHLALRYLCMIMLVGFQPTFLLRQDDTKKGDVDSASTPNRSSSMLFTVNGKVVTESEQPIPNAKIMVRRMYENYDIERRLFRSYKYPRLLQLLAVGQTNRHGNFSLDFAKYPGSHTLFAYRTGYAPSGTWASPHDPFQIRLRPGVSVRGTVVDQDNRPLKSAKIRLMAWFTYEANFRSLAERQSDVQMEGDLENGAIRLETQTAGNGTFRLDDLPQNRWVVLVVSADKFLPKCVVVDTGNDPMLEVAVSTQRFFDEGVIRLQPATRVELFANGKDDGSPIKLQAAYMAEKDGLRSTFLEIDRALPLEIIGNRAVLPALPPGGNRFGLVPEHDTGYMGALIDIDFDDSTSLIKKQIELVRGARVVGRVVDAVTRKPIADVPIHYDPDSVTEFLEIGANIAPVLSDEKGEFAMNVPPITGWLRQIGHVEGYRSIGFDPNKDMRGIAPSQKIVPTLDQETHVEFRLFPGMTLNLRVLDSQGQPVAKARYITKQWISETRSTSQSGMADEQGRIKLPNMFAAMRMEQSDEDQSTHNPLEETVYICSPDLQATATVRLPDPVRWQPEISLDVILNPASSIQGRLVDFATRRGIENVWVNVWYDDHLAQSELGIYSVRSDANGDFTLRPIFPDSPFRMNISQSYIGYRSQQRYTAPMSADYHLGEIVVFDYRDLEQLLDVPDVTGLSSQQAFETLSTALSRVRGRMKEVFDWQSGWNRRDSIAKAEITVSERFGEAFLKLSQQTKDPDLKFSILLHLFSNMNSFITPNSFYADRAKTALLEQFMHREDELVDLLPMILSSYDTKHWQRIFDRSKIDELKSLACQNLVSTHFDDLASLIVWGSSSEKQISDKISELRPLLRYAFGEASEHQFNESGTLRAAVTESLKRAWNHIDSRASELDTKKKALFESMVTEWLPDQGKGDK